MSSSAPKRRLDVRHQSSVRAASTSAGGRRAAKRRSKRSFRPSMATVGAVALVVAGLGSAVLSGRADTGTLDGDFQALSAETSNGGFQVSRDFDRELLEEQTQNQADQMLQAQQELQQLTQDRADDLQSNQWVLPVAGYRISATFGQSSSLWSSGRHTGLDFSGPSGSTIVSVSAGEVVSVGYEGAYGNRTVIRLDDGTEIWYCHQSRIVVEAGQRVIPGEVIGYTGSTGNTTGPHLHLEVRPGGGDPVDPEVALREHNANP
ncbi:MAG: M23 family metallopeptidase [Aeromicrobium sp.]|uniref:M23 family metallopeptidase n=1 Tax=Aeromicrobium sp. TaxID=1871063 RepID=UPI0039E621BF